MQPFFSHILATCKEAKQAKRKQGRGGHLAEVSLHFFQHLRGQFRKRVVMGDGHKDDVIVHNATLVTV
jgi:hypothetical protein